ncbi:hypothetical protein FS749_013489 [Ceratobasidium sp. UAMH 11750]|nr:hypothetical protein FS749_013489 [Ceratobasidium sp. UAMH 11750]
MPIKFFLTSRPEPTIRSRMLRRNGHRDRFELHLHELDKGVVREDVKKYLQASLKHPDLTLSNEHLEILTEHSGVLFIYAATVVRYISVDDFSRGDERLKDVLEATTGSNDSDQAICSLYNLILKRAFERPHLIARDRAEMRLVLETVVCAQEPLTVHVMTSLLGLKGERSVDVALSLLRSVLDVQNDGTITTLHKSFLDHMLDPTRSLNFCCDPNMRHGWLAQRCLDLISIPYPPFNICGSDVSHARDDVLSLEHQIKRLVPKALTYAHRYWGVHLRHTRQHDNILDRLGRFLFVRLLLSMEVVNLTMVMLHGVETLSQASIPEFSEYTGWGLVTQAVAIAITLQRYDLALEWFEQGHSILWGQTLQLHTPYDDLYAGNLETVKQLQQILYQPECLTMLEGVKWPSAHNGGNLHENAWRHRLAERRKELLEFARILPGLEDSLRPPDASKLVSLVQDGTVVVINLDGNRCDALVVRSGTQKITHVPLTGFSVSEAEHICTGLALNPPPGSIPGGFRGEPSASHFIVDYDGILAGLWRDIVAPVLKHRGIPVCPSLKRNGLL